MSSKISGSSSMRRRMIATTVTIADAQNGMRQPQLSRASSGRAAIGMNTRLEITMPNMIPPMVQLVKNARRRSGACSRVSELDPGDSPPAEMPWMRRSTTMMIGAAMPMASQVGMQPTRKVATPMITRHARRARLRPKRSPMWPQRIAPNGRAT